MLRKRGGSSCRHTRERRHWSVLLLEEGMGRTALDHAGDKEGFAAVRALLRGKRGALTAVELKARADVGRARDAKREL